MKKTISKALAITIIGLSSPLALAASLLPETVGTLNAERYMGRWYEIASTKPSFQKDCVCVTADYALIDEKTVKVTNSCRKKTVDGALDVVVGTAGTTSEPGKFNVSFGNFRLPFSNYWVVDLADDYSYAVVSSPFRTPIWILSRTPELDREVLDGIYARLAAAGFNVEKLTPTLQQGCD